MTDPFNAPTTIDEARAVVADQRNANLNASLDAATTDVQSQAPATSVSFGSSARSQNLPTLDRLTKTFGPVIKYPPSGNGIEYVHPVTDPSAPVQLPTFTAAQLSKYSMNFQELIQHSDKERKQTVSTLNLRLAREGKMIENNERLRDNQRTIVPAITTAICNVFKVMGQFLQQNRHATEEDILIMFEQLKFFVVQWAMSSGKSLMEMLVAISEIPQHRNAFINEYMNEFPAAQALLTTNDKILIVTREHSHLEEALKEGIDSCFSKVNEAGHANRIRETAAFSRIGLSQAEIETISRYTYNVSTDKFDIGKVAKAWVVAGCANTVAKRFASGDLYDGMFSIVILDEAHRFPCPGNTPKSDVAGYDRIYNQSRKSFFVLSTATPKGWVEKGFESIHQEELHVNTTTVSRVTYGHNFNDKRVTSITLCPVKITNPVVMQYKDDKGVVTNRPVNLSEPLTQLEAQSARSTEFAQREHIYQAMACQIDAHAKYGVPKQLLGFSPEPLYQGAEDQANQANAASTSAAAPVVIDDDNEFELQPLQLAKIAEDIVKTNKKKFTSPVTKLPLRIGFVSSGKDKKTGKPVQTPKERAQILAEFRDGKIDVLFNYKICSEGFSNELIGIILNFNLFNPLSDSSWNRMVQALIGRLCRAIMMTPRLVRIAKRDGWFAELSAYCQLEVQDGIIIDASYAQHGELRKIATEWSSIEGAKDAIIPGSSSQVTSVLIKHSAEYRETNAIARSVAQHALVCAAASSGAPVAPPKTKEQIDKAAKESTASAKATNAARMTKKIEEQQRRIDALKHIMEIGDFDSGVTTISPQVSDGCKMLYISHDSPVPVNDLITTSYSVFAVFCAPNTSPLVLQPDEWYELDIKSSHCKRNCVSFTVELDSDKPFNYIKVRATNTVRDQPEEDADAEFFDAPHFQVDDDIDAKFAALLAPKPPKPASDKRSTSASIPDSPMPARDDDDEDPPDDDTAPAAERVDGMQVSVSDDANSDAEESAPLFERSKRVGGSTAVRSLATGRASGSVPSLPQQHVSTAELAIPAPVFGRAAGDNARPSGLPCINLPDGSDSSDEEVERAVATRKRKPAEDRPVELTSGPRSAKKAALTSIASASSAKDKPTKKPVSHDESDDEYLFDDEEFMSHSDDDDDDDDDDASSSDEESDDDDEDYEAGEGEVEEDLDDVFAPSDDDDHASEKDANEETGEEMQVEEDAEAPAPKEKKKRAPRKPTRLPKTIGYYNIANPDSIKLKPPAVSVDPLLGSSVSAMPLSAEVISMQQDATGQSFKFEHQRDVNTYDTSKLPKPPPKPTYSAARPVNAQVGEFKNKKAHAVVDSTFPELAEMAENFANELLANSDYPVTTVDRAEHYRTRLYLCFRNALKYLDPTVFDVSSIKSIATVDEKELIAAGMKGGLDKQYSEDLARAMRWFRQLAILSPAGSSSK